jgi:hypothetical protein
MRIAVIYFLAVFLAAIPAAHTAPYSEIIKKDIQPLTKTNIHQLYQFNKGTYVENIAVRSNGNLIVTLLDRPEVYELNPQTPNQEPRLVWQFQKASRVAGIVETSADQFAVVVGTYLLLNTFGGSYSIWSVDLRSAQAKATPVSTNIPNAGLMNGLALIPNTTILLSTDTLNGVIHRIDLRTGAASVAMSKELGATSSITFGMNGLRIRDGYAYYTNTLTGLFCKIPIDTVTGAARGPAQVIASGLTGVDDFALAPEPDSAFIAYLFKNEIVHVYGGTTSVLAGSPTSGVVNGPCSAQFGRGPDDRRTLYVVTSGSSLLPVPDAGTGGGKVLAIEM